MRASLPDVASIIRHRLTEELPGAAAHEQLAIVHRDKFTQAPLHALQSAVCLLLFPKEERIHVVYIQRAQHPNDKHSGQISFPGGAKEDTDTDLQATAIRELAEETGILLPESNILGPLSPIYIPVSNFEVQPFMAYLTERPSVLKQESEVAEIFSVELAHMMRKEILYKDMEVRGWRIKNTPFFDINGKTLWGATAMITNEMRAIMDDVWARIV